MSATWLHGARVVPAPGLRPFYSSEGECALIDAGIVDIIQMLNQLGCETMVSCSGLDADHKDERTWFRAYIGFRNTPRKAVLRAFVMAGFTLDPNAGNYYCIRGFDSGKDADGHDGSNERIAAKWNAVRVLLSGMTAASSRAAHASP